MTYYKKNDLIYKITCKLNEHNIGQADIDFIESKIHPIDNDPDIWVTSHDLDYLLEKQREGLSKVFHQVSDECGIQWYPITAVESNDLAAYMID